MDPIIVRPRSARRPNSVLMIWSALLLGWFVILCIVPDPRPIGAPEWAVGGIGSLTGLSEPAARAVTTIALRGIGLGLFGLLLSLSLGPRPLRWAVPVVLVLAPLLAVASQWISYGYFPILTQIQLGVLSAVVGSLIGFTLRRSRIAMGVLVTIAAGLFVWGTSTGISDDLDRAARATGLHLLANVNEIPTGDDGFAKLLHSAFAFAEDNSHGTDAVLPNKAAILALGVILGEEKVAEVAKRQIDFGRKKEFEALRGRITLRSRHDLARHFWVSAALAILADENRSMTVGIGKEMMDSTSGGSGFSFVDLTADRAGTLFAVAATNSTESARDIQSRIRRGVDIADYCPDVQGLPEGISRDDFQSEYGGLGGKETERIVEEIRRRLAACEGLTAEH